MTTSEGAGAPASAESKMARSVRQKTLDRYRNEVKHNSATRNHTRCRSNRERHGVSITTRTRAVAEAATRSSTRGVWERQTPGPPRTAPYCRPRLWSERASNMFRDADDAGTSSADRVSGRAAEPQIRVRALSAGDNAYPPAD